MNAPAKTKPNLQKRGLVTADVFTRYRKKTELEDGYALFYPANDDWTDKLEYFANTWQKTCPFFSFSTKQEDDGTHLCLEIRGPEGTKQFIDNAQRILTSNINPAPTIAQKMKWRFASLTGNFRGLPDFLIIGAKKCGTTSLYAYLLQHPDVAAAIRKEVNFFNLHYHKGSSWYRRHFPMRIRRFMHRAISGHPLLTGEATPDYLFNSVACERIAADLPAVRLLAILRNPVDRAYSAYQHQVRCGMETQPFEQAIAAERQKAREKKKKVKGTYLGRGVYVDHLQMWIDRFSSEQVFVLSTEELEYSPAHTMQQVCRWMGLRDFDWSDFPKFNAVPYPEMQPHTRQELQEYYQPHNCRLFELLGRSLPWDVDETLVRPQPPITTEKC